MVLKQVDRRTLLQRQLHVAPDHTAVTGKVRVDSWCHNRADRHGVRLLGAARNQRSRIHRHAARDRLAHRGCLGLCCPLSLLCLRVEFTVTRLAFCNNPYMELLGYSLSLHMARQQIWPVESLFAAGICTRVGGFGVVFSSWRLRCSARVKT
jgi:hypothetical protein